MPVRAIKLCRPCLKKKYPLRKQLLLSFLTLAAVRQQQQETQLEGTGEGGGG